MRNDRRLRCWTAISILTVCNAASAQLDPFAAQLRWKHGPSGNVTWLPSSVDFGAGGEVVWAAASGASPRAMLFASSELGAADVAPVAEDSGLAGSSGAIAVRGSDDEHALFSLAQYPHPDAQHRRTEVARYDAFGAQGGGSFAPAWRHSLALVGNGSARIASARDGARVAAAAHDSASATLELQWIDGANGATAQSITVASQALRELAASADAVRIAIVAGAKVSLFDESGATLFAQDLGSATNALACSGDGRTLAFGLGGRVRVVSEQNGAFQLAQDHLGAFGEVPIELALSDDGATLAIAWWNQVSGTVIHCQVFQSGAPTFDLYQGGNPGGLQNFPTAACVTRDGRRAMFAAWGTGDPAPELWLADAHTGSLVLTRDLGGSALCAALDETGTRIVVGVKNVHANQFGASGEVRAYDTGERDCQVLGTSSAGQGLSLTARRSGASRAFFVLGVRLATPVPFPGSAHPLSIDRSLGARVFARPCDATGRANLHVPLPLGVLGFEFSAQAAFRAHGALELTAAVVDPAIF
jgi:hypothetical protein